MLYDKRRHVLGTFLLVPAVALILIVFVYPVGWLLLQSFSYPDWGLQNFSAIVVEIVYHRILWNTVIITISVTALCLIIGYPVAYTLAHSSPRIRRVVILAILIPFWTSLLVRSFAWLVLLRDEGLINNILVGIGIITEPLALIYNRSGVLIGTVQVQLAFMILPLFSIMLRIDPAYSKAASTLGATPIRNFLRIYLPLSLPGVVTGCGLVFTITLGYFILPQLLGGPSDSMIGQLIATVVGDFGDWGLAGALSVVLLFGAGTTMVLMKLTSRKFGGPAG